MEGYCSPGRSPQWAVVTMEVEEEEERCTRILGASRLLEGRRVHLKAQKMRYFPCVSLQTMTYVTPRAKQKMGHEP